MSEIETLQYFEIQNCNECLGILNLIFKFGFLNYFFHSFKLIIKFIYLFTFCRDSIEEFLRFPNIYVFIYERMAWSVNFYARWIY